MGPTVVPAVPRRGPGRWRGFGGGPSTARSVEFDRQLDKVSLWVEQWDHDTRCRILERLLRDSSYSQLRLLWTVMQPVLHRDFMYTASKSFPGEDFTPISIHANRQVNDRLARMHQVNYFRIKSAYIENLEELEQVTRGLSRGLTLPSISSSPSSNSSNLDRSTGSKVSRAGSSSGQAVALATDDQGTHSSSARIGRISNVASAPSLSKSPRRSRAVARNSGWSNERCSLDGFSALTSSALGSDCCRSQYSHNSQTTAQPPCIRFIDMPVRRHMQDEEGLGRHDNVALLQVPLVSSVPASWTPSWSIMRFPSLPPPSPPLTSSVRVKQPTDISTSTLEPEPLKVTPRAERTSFQGVGLSQGGVDLGTDDDRKMVRKQMQDYQAAIAAAVADIPREGWQLISWYKTMWNELQRNEFFHKLLLKLDQRQHFFISSFLSVKQHVDIVGLLPEAVALRILSYLSPKELCRAAWVSKTWLRLCNNNQLWKYKCQETKLEIPIPLSSPVWKTLFKENKSVTANWRSGNCAIVECKGHSNRVLSVTFNGKHMATGSLDRTVKIWDLQDGRCLQTLQGHVKGVWALRFFTPNLLISASYDSTIRVWNLREGVCMRVLIGHEGPVWAIERYENLLVSVSQDNTGKIWDVRRSLLIRTLRGHHGPVYCVDIDDQGSVIVTGSADRSVRLWCLESGKQLRVVWISPNQSVMAVSYDRGWLACSHGTAVSLYRADSATLHATYDEHTKRVECLELKIKDPDSPAGTIISAGKDGVLKQWDITKETSAQTFVGSTRQVNCVHFDELRIASAAYDNKIKIWDYTKFQPQ